MIAPDLAFQEEPGVVLARHFRPDSADGFSVL
jgi:hypothetical protein